MYGVSGHVGRVGSFMDVSRHVESVSGKYASAMKARRQCQGEVDITIHGIDRGLFMRVGHWEQI